MAAASKMSVISLLIWGLYPETMTTRTQRHHHSIQTKEFEAWNPWNTHNDIVAELERVPARKLPGNTHNGTASHFWRRPLQPNTYRIHTARSWQSSSVPTQDYFENLHRLALSNQKACSLTFCVFLICNSHRTHTTASSLNSNASWLVAWHPQKMCL